VAYSRVIGAGDITGDGKADLLLLAGNALYGLHATGTGTFTNRFLVGTGYRGYNSVIGAGDVDDDGHNDVVARDASGNLWLLPGNGHNGFGNRIRLGTGYQKYAYLY
jgi:FG-GAP-like repeat